MTDQQIQQMANDLNITSSKDVNQMRITQLEDKSYAMQISLHGKSGWHTISTGKTYNEAEVQGAKVLYDQNTADKVSYVHKTLDSEANSDYLSDSDTLRHESVIETPSEGKYADTDGMIIGD